MVGAPSGRTSSSPHIRHVERRHGQRERRRLAKRGPTISPSAAMHPNRLETPALMSLHRLPSEINRRDVRMIAGDQRLALRDVWEPWRWRPLCRRTPTNGVRPAPTRDGDSDEMRGRQPQPAELDACMKIVPSTPIDLRQESV